MKKLVALLLSIVLILTLSGISVIAASDDGRLPVDEAMPMDELGIVARFSEEEVSPHSEATLNLSLSVNPGFCVMILDITYLSQEVILEEITLKEATCSASGMTVSFSNHSGGSTIAFYNGDLSSDYIGTGLLATLVFNIGAYFGDAQIVFSAEEGNVCNAQAIPLATDFSESKPAITVSCSHTYVFKDRVEPSCSTEGATNYICTICSNIRSVIIDKTPHSYSDEKQIVREAACETEGIKAYVCERCGEWDEETQESIPALQHQYGDEDYTVTKNPTCTEPGSRYKYCYRCKTNVAEEIPALGHDEGTWRVTTPGDCTETGIMSCYCNRCDQPIKTEVKQSSGHIKGFVVTKKPTCHEAGEEQYMCLICGGEKGETREIPELNHIHGKEVITKEPTCSETGTAEIYCKLCDELFSTREIDKLPHTKSSLTVTQAPTSQAEGTGEYRCKVCSEIIESVTLPKTYCEIYGENAVAFTGRKASVKVFIKENPGFSVGIVRIRYDYESLIYQDVAKGEITDDITANVTAAGEIAVLVSLNDAQYTQNGLLFTLNFTLTADADNSDIEIFYDADKDFADKNGDRVFVNMKSARIEISTGIPGDVNGDNTVDTVDLAKLKLHLAGLDDDISAGTDADGNGRIDTGDLATLKLMLAGIIK